MAVAPLNMVRRVAEYALTQIPKEKIILGIPNYGYDWPLPYVRGTTKARTIGNVEAVQLAISHGASIRFDEQAQSPYFHYAQNGVRHEVWFEDVRSYRAKFALIRELGLKGALKAFDGFACYMETEDMRCVMDMDTPADYRKILAALAVG